MEPAAISREPIARAAMPKFFRRRCALRSPRTSLRSSVNSSTKASPALMALVLMLMGRFPFEGR